MESKAFRQIIADLLFVYGDIQSDQDQTLAPTLYEFLQQLAAEVFHRPTLANFLKKNKLQKEVYNLKKLKYYLTVLLGEVVNNFFQFKSMQEKVHRSTQTDTLSVTRESRQDFLMALLHDSPAHIDILKVEQKVFISKRVDTMTDAQFQSFHQLRLKSFLDKGEKAFQQEFRLMDLFSKIKSKRRTQFSSLINYIFCKFIEDLVHRVIKQRDPNGILSPLTTRLTLQEIKTSGAKVIARVVQNKNAFLSRLEKNLEKEAYRLFEKDYHICAYDQLLSLQGENAVALSWKKMTNYKNMWVQRVQAQQQLALMEKNGIKISSLKGKLQELQNKYLEYLVNQLIRLQKEYLSECAPELLGRVFKDYLTNNRKVEPEERPMKRVKLESVFD